MPSTNLCPTLHAVSHSSALDLVADDHVVVALSSAQPTPIARLLCFHGNLDNNYVCVQYMGEAGDWVGEIKGPNGKARFSWKQLELGLHPTPLEVKPSWSWHACKSSPQDINPRPSTTARRLIKRANRAVAPPRGLHCEHHERDNRVCVMNNAESTQSSRNVVAGASSYLGNVQSNLSLQQKKSYVVGIVQRYEAAEVFRAC